LLVLWDFCQIHKDPDIKIGIRDVFRQAFYAHIDKQIKAATDTAEKAEAAGYHRHQIEALVLRSAFTALRLYMKPKTENFEAHEISDTEITSLRKCLALCAQLPNRLVGLSHDIVHALEITRKGFSNGAMFKSLLKFASIQTNSVDYASLYANAETVSRCQTLLS
jgi:hypothetical protein